MPLLHKKPFELNPIPDDMSDDELVFICQPTGEIFREYTEFRERVILCNSLVWSCSLTGRSNLTYREALISEEKVKRLLKRFPMELRIPVLYLASICERRSLIDLAEEVFNYVNLRYFIGETVQVTFPDAVVYCSVLSVVPPTLEEIGSLSKSDLHKNGDRHYPPAVSYKYEVERHDNSIEAIVSPNQMARKKTAYNKDKNRLYIKQFVHLQSGVWKLKESASIKYGVNKVKFDQIFCGEPPDMNPKSNKRKRASSDKPKKQETIHKYFKSADKKFGVPKRSPRKSEVMNALNKRKRRRSKKEIEAVNSSKIKALELKQKHRDQAKQNKLKYAEFVKQWNMKREDLECEDLKELPETTPVESALPNEYFGYVAMIMEFIQSFQKILQVRDFFPNGVTFELMERALMDKEIAGPYCDLVQLLLSGIFDLVDSEMDEIRETDVKLNPGLIFDRGTPTTLKTLKNATRMAYWVKKYHGMHVSQLTLDTSTLTEILRLHILTSGARPNKTKVAKWRFQARGGYCNNDDPCVELKTEHPHIVNELSIKSVCDLDIKDKLLIVNCLMNQVLTFSAARDITEEGCDKARQCRIELRALRAEQARKEKEEALRLKELKKDASSKPVVENEEEKAKSLKIAKASIEQLDRDMREALAGAQMSPLGMDRAYRRYWMFTALPGLFIEDDEPNKGECLPKCTPMVSFNGIAETEDNMEYIKRLFQENSNKENMVSTNHNLGHTTPKKLLAEKNGSDSPLKWSYSKGETAKKAFTCWADPVNCPVHGTNATHTVWSFIKDPEDIERLITSLNTRGIRERRLKQVLTQEKDNIIELINKCPVDKLNTALESNTQQDLRLRNKIMKIYENANLGYPLGTPLNEIMESSLRDLILETEEKVFAGALGAIKVKDRDAWRAALRNNSYDKQCKKLTWGTTDNEIESDNDLSDRDDAIKNSDELSLIDDAKIEFDELQGPKEEAKEEMESDIKKEETGSRASSPSIDGNDNEPVEKLDIVPQRPVILDLASAILQVEQGIDYKFLKRPLGLDKKERDRGEKMPPPVLHRWEKALMSSTNYPQLFLHLATLENSVTWKKSAMNAFCRVCRKGTDPENMLLCDTCNQGHHLYCLKPKLTCVPNGDWFCPRCRPKEKTTFKKKRRLFSEDSDFEDENPEQICKQCSEPGAELTCDLCDIKLHLNCVNPVVRKVPKSKWFCHQCRIQAQTKKDSLPVNENVKEEENIEPVIENQEVKEVKEVKQEKKIGRPRKEKTAERQNGYLNNHCQETDMTDWTSPERLSPTHIEWDRSSRRKSSKAATAKISLFAKQLRSSQWTENGELDESEDRMELPISRRSRRSVEYPKKKMRDLPLDNAALQEILDTLMHHNQAWPFLKPVSKSEVPDYHMIIKKPMDFGTIKHKLNMLEYSRNCELIADANLLFYNCSLYNQEGSEVFIAGEVLKKLFEQLCREYNLIDDEDFPATKKARTVL